jgi:processive 1,2-diacylglycerol beta-glucosyltransferase
MLNTKAFVDFLRQEGFELVISTHFLSTEIVSYLKSKGLIQPKLITIVTDFKTHRFWDGKHVDYYMVGADSTKKMMAERGTDAERIMVTGIPLRKGFRKKIKKEEIAKKLDIAADVFTVLVMGGGFGVGPIEDIVLNLQKLEFHFQIIVVCGYNSKLCERLKFIVKDLNKPSRILGFCSAMEEMMAVSDIIVSKAGAITVSEALSKGVPFITLNPIPGQEGRNVKFLSDNGLGFKVKSPSELNIIIKRFHEDTKTLDDLRSHIRSYAKPHSAERITEFSAGIIK